MPIMAVEEWHEFRNDMLVWTP